MDYLKQCCKFFMLNQYLYKCILLHNLLVIKETKWIKYALIYLQNLR